MDLSSVVSEHQRGSGGPEPASPPGLAGERGGTTSSFVGQARLGWLGEDNGASVGSGEEARQEKGSLPLLTLPEEERRGPHLRRLQGLPGGALARNPPVSAGGRSLVWEDPTRREAAEPVCCNH